jgi:aspartate 1-decarboxylase
MVGAMRWLMRSKLHNATVTEPNLTYVRLIAIEQDLIEAVGFWVSERVPVADGTTSSNLGRPALLDQTVAADHIDAAKMAAACDHIAAAELLCAGTKMRSSIILG